VKRVRIGLVYYAMIPPDFDESRLSDILRLIEHGLGSFLNADSGAILIEPRARLSINHMRAPKKATARKPAKKPAKKGRAK
jgi:hypothetical protein